ncbi:MAG: fumarylacetoacetate hydrolase family protein [Azonexus sp.]|nr:fumarylacetoacetate hydrolase family protein [Azonexus sp.]
MPYLFEPPSCPTLPILGRDALFPVRRIFCVGRNYAEHAREMGAHDQANGLEPPFFFTKPGDALIGGLGELAVHYPPMTGNLHHEVEMVAALGAGGADVSTDQALSLVAAYGVGLDLTRRDLQAQAKAKGHPWDMGKGFDQSAVCGALQLVEEIGHPDHGEIWLKVNGEVRQRGDLGDMGWKVADIVSNLSRLVCLAPGDLIYTGTPAGVGPLLRGDRLEAGVAGLAELRAHIV